MKDFIFLQVIEARSCSQFHRGGKSSIIRASE
jgi:hypothetical protein